MLKLALCVSYGALTRTESRGAHFRQDFPRRNDAEWLKRTLATWKGDETLPTLAYEALDVAKMELPPGWRGYGAKDYVDHPDTPARAAEVDALKQKMAGASRFAVQEALMPYDALLPERAARAQRTDRRTLRGLQMSDATVVKIVPAPQRRRQRQWRKAPGAEDQRAALQSAGQGERAADADATTLEEADGMTLFIALNEIREKLDASLQFDFVCRAGICGSCAMVINGRPTLACRTLTKNLPAEITLAPLPFFELIGDLSVDTGKWMRGMSERLEGWLHMKDPNPDLTRIEERMDPDLADKIYELDRCIECGCCVAACGTARMREDFVGAVGLNRVARFRLDPRDTRTDARLLRRDRRRRRRVRLHVAARLPRRVPEGTAACDADRVHAAQDGEDGLEQVARTACGPPRPFRRSGGAVRRRAGARGVCAPRVIVARRRSAATPDARAGEERTSRTDHRRVSR